MNLSIKAESTSNRAIAHRSELFNVGAKVEVRTNGAWGKIGEVTSVELRARWSGTDLATDVRYTVYYGTVNNRAQVEEFADIEVREAPLF